MNWSLPLKFAGVWVEVFVVRGKSYAFFATLCMLLQLILLSQPVLATDITLSGARITNASVATADFNGDGYKEIVAGGGDGMLYVISTSDGISWSTVWSRQCNVDIEAANPPSHKSTNEIYASPAIADLDRDGHLEIVVAMGGNVHVLNHDDSLRDNGGVLVYRYNSLWNFSLNEVLSADGSRGWPQPRIDAVGLGAGYSDPDGYWDGIMTTPALGDLDGDGDLEIVVAGIDRRIHAWHHTGEVVQGWPIYRGINDEGDAITRGGMSSPVLGDLDRDGLLEVIVATMSPPWDKTKPISPTNPDYTKATLWAINGDSTNVPGFPVATEQYFHSSPALGDVNQDGFLEIIIGSGYGLAGRENIVSVYNHEGSLLPNWPRETSGLTMASPSLADIDNDGMLEIISGCGSEGAYYDCGSKNLYAWNIDGSNVPGFPASIPTASLLSSEVHSTPYVPIIADLDGDGTLEILVVETFAWGITLVNHDGSVAGYRRTLSGLQAPPVVDDIDGDGKLEILIGAGDGNAVVSIWDEDGAYSSGNLPWPMDRKNIERTGLFAAVTFLPPPIVSQLRPIVSIFSLLLK
jgi:hypothetical protein